MAIYKPAEKNGDHSKRTLRGSTMAVFVASILYRRSGPFVVQTRCWLAARQQAHLIGKVLWDTQNVQLHGNCSPSVLLEYIIRLLIYYVCYSNANVIGFLCIPNLPTGVSEADKCTCCMTTL